MCSVLISEIY